MSQTRQRIALTAHSASQASADALTLQGEIPFMFRRTCAAALLLTIALADSVPWASPSRTGVPLLAGEPAVDRKSSRSFWPEFGGSPQRNNARLVRGLPDSWSPVTGENVRWSAELGTQTNGTPVVADGRVYIGTNNGAAYLKRYPRSIDLGCLLCFDAGTGQFLWQFSAEKLPTGRLHDWPHMGICSTPRVQGERLWVVSNRGEILCLDTQGFRDGENDGVYQRELLEAEDEADVVWSLDMMREFGVQQHNMASCSITGADGVLFVSTSNGVDKSHECVPAPQAPSFLALDETTGEVLWTDNSPGSNILHGQWASPALGEIAGVSQVIFAGGDGWLYSFDARGDGRGNAKLLWKCDCNAKESFWRSAGNGTRNNIIATPVVSDGHVYVATGADPEKRVGRGDLWCINAAHRLDGSDVSSHLAIDAAGNRIPHRRLQAVDPERGERAVANHDSAVVWRYNGCDSNGDGDMQFSECLHRTLSSVAIGGEVLVLPDLAGVVHCLNPKTGRLYWSHDLMECIWASPLIADGRIFIATDSGTVAVFRCHSDPQIALRDGSPLVTIDMKHSMHATPIAADAVLYLATKRRLYAIASQE